MYIYIIYCSHLFPMQPFSITENRKPYGSLMFSGDRERVHWEKLGYYALLFLQPIWKMMNWGDFPKKIEQLLNSFCGSLRQRMRKF